MQEHCALLIGVLFLLAALYTSSLIVDGVLYGLSPSLVPFTLDVPQTKLH